MDPSINPPPLNIAALLREYNLKPKKGLGQNFLVDSTVLEHIIASAEITSENDVLEIGPGLGSLTRLLANRAREVVAVEIDRHLLPVLKDVLRHHNNVRIVPGDILEIDPAELVQSDGYLVVANIPYYITSAVIRHLLEAKYKPIRMILTIQREVAERICAAEGDLSLLALSVQVYGAPRQVFRIPAGAFYPPPKVDSTVLRVDLYPEPLIPPDILETFFRLAKAGFSQKRKTLRNALSAGLRRPAEATAVLLKSTGIDPQRRAETVSLEEWRRLTEKYSANK
jgi:16S rRNA (adenine1518-N6/adenine1519-N6)-dimethyltransferase